MGYIPSIYVFSAGAAAIAVAGFFIHRLIKPIDLETHQQFLDATLNIVGTLVSIVLGLLVAAALDHYQSLDESIDGEAANVSQVFRLSTGLPSPLAIRLRKLCLDYSAQVVDEEWPAMARGEWSPKVLGTYTRLLVEVARFHPHTEGETNLHAALISSVQEIGDARRKRILVLHSNWTKQLMPLLMLCSGIVLIFAYLYVRRGVALHAILIAFVAVALGSNLGLVYLLGNPYAGDWKIQPRGFELNRKVLTGIMKDPEMQKIFATETTQSAEIDSEGSQENRQAEK